MMKFLIVAAAVGFAASSANACDFLRSAANKTDETKVASITADEPQKMSTPAQPSADGAPVIVEQLPATEKAE